MTRGIATATRVVLERRTPLVRCTYPVGEGGIANQYGSCGEMIPHAPRRPCPSCGQKQLNATASAPGPNARIIDGSAVVVDAETDQVVVAQAVGFRRLADDMAKELRTVHWDAPVTKRNKPANEGRLSGIVVTHRTFGFRPPVPLRRRYECARCIFDTEYPRAAGLIAEMCQVSERVFREYATEVHDRTTERVRETIPPAWLIAGTPWSSGIINHTAALPYHRDSGNVPGSWSAMLTCRRGVDGGLLHLVDYDAWLAVPNGSVAIFDGQSVLHGVTPFRLTGANAYRYTLVTYARRGMAVCSPDPADEARRAARSATEAEDRRAAR